MLDPYIIYKTIAFKIALSWITFLLLLLLFHIIIAQRPKCMYVENGVNIKKIVTQIS